MDPTAYQFYCKNCCAWVSEDDAYVDAQTGDDCCPHCGLSLEEDEE